MAIFEITTFAALAKLLLAGRKLATDPDPLNRAKALTELAQNGKTLTAAIRGAGLSPLAARMEARASHLDRHLTHEGWAKDDARLIFWQAAPLALADPRHMTAAALDPDATTEAMIAVLHASPLARDFRQTTYAEEYFRKIMTGTLEVMLAEKSFVDSITPALWRQCLANQGLQLARLEALKDDTGEILALVRALHNTHVPEATLIAIARKIRPQVADRDQALKELERAADIAAGMVRRGAIPGNTDAWVDAVLRRLAELTEAGELDTAAAEADTAFAAWEDQQAREAANGARLLSAAIDQHLLAFDADAAAALIARRVAMDTPDPAARFDALRAEYTVWYERGRDAGLALDLRVAISLARISLESASGPDQCGTALNYQGTALAVLGTRETGPERLLEAVTAFRAALEEWTRDRAPLHWARVQMNLGNVLQTLGQRESGPERLLQAVAAYSDALQERTRDLVPLDWAMTHNNLGTALLTLGTREIGPDRLREAIAAFEAALQEQTRDVVPLDWAMTQNNLGHALQTLGAREIGPDRLLQAIAACEAALQERTRDRVPLDWAGTQLNLGAALATLGERESGPDRLLQAVAAYSAALQELTRDRMPLEWARTQMNLGAALATLGERESGPQRLLQAVAAYSDALLVWTRDRVPLDWARTRENMALANLALFQKTGDRAQLNLARSALAEALAVYTEAGAAFQIDKATRVRDDIASF